jgi:tungstate transport system ATP-binding protein
MMAQTSIYQLSRVQKRYKGRTALSLEQLSVQEGETLAVMGPSGAGKSTLLRLLNFLERPDAGSIAYSGEVWEAANIPPLAIRRQITTVFQRPILLDTTVRANVAYGLKLRGEPIDRRVDAVLERVGMAHLAATRARTLSGGEAQRVALARAIVLEPRMLLLDEPTANLDPHNVATIEAIVRELHKQRGTTIVIVTHNVFQARRLADRAALLLEGELVEIGLVEQMFSAPRSPRTAAFISGELVY